MSKPTPDVIDSTNDPIFNTQIRSRQHLVPSPSRAPLNGIAWAYREDDAVPLDQTQALIAAAISGGGGGPTLQDSYTAGATVGGNRLVYLQGGQIFLFDALDTTLWGKLIGFTKSAGLAGTPVIVVKAGKMVNPGWGLIPDTVYYAASNGLITTTPPSIDLDIPVGLAIDANTLEINIFEQVILT